MVGTHGVVSAVDGTDRAVYAGTVLFEVYYAMLHDTILPNCSFSTIV